MIRYRNTQFGWVIVGVILAISAIVLLASFNDPVYKELKLLIAFILLSIVLLFHSLTTIVTDTHVKIYFGVGLIRRAIPLGEIENCKVKKNQFVLGWGIRIGMGFTLWNVSGFDAVELTLKNRKWKFRVGTDRPEELQQAIETAIRAQ